VYIYALVALQQFISGILNQEFRLFLIQLFFWAPFLFAGIYLWGPISVPVLQVAQMAAPSTLCDYFAA
jgi:hypothetical protein